jgi:hypothetical protein
MVSGGITQTPISEFSDYQSGFSIGGPMMPNKAFYFGNYDNQRKKTPTGFSVGGTGQQSLVGNEALFNQFVADLKNHLRLRRGSNAGGEYVKPLQSDKVFVRGRFQPGPQPAHAAPQLRQRVAGRRHAEHDGVHHSGLVSTGSTRRRTRRSAS